MKLARPSVVLLAATIAAALCGISCAHDDSGDLKAEVAASMTAVAKGDHGPVSRLKAKAALAIPYLGPYVQAPESDVRAAVVEIVGGLGTPEALRILVSLVDDDDDYVGGKSVAALFADYSLDVIRDTGSVQLRDRLRRRIERVNSPAKAILLLGCFSDHDGTREFLRSISKARRGKTKLEHWSMVVNLSLCFAVSLAEGGDSAGKEAVMQYISTRKIEDLVFILGAVKFIRSAAILSRMVDLMDDMRDAVPGAPSRTGYYLRTCDVALGALVPVLAVRLDFDSRTRRRFSDDELLKARAAFREAVRTLTETQGGK